jgi:hypothetical protein
MPEETLLVKPKANHLHHRKISYFRLAVFFLGDFHMQLFFFF